MFKQGELEGIAMGRLTWADVWLHSLCAKVEGLTGYKTDAAFQDHSDDSLFATLRVTDRETRHEGFIYWRRAKRCPLPGADLNTSVCEGMDEGPLLRDTVYFRPGMTPFRTVEVAVCRPAGE